MESARCRARAAGPSRGRCGALLSIALLAAAAALASSVASAFLVAAPRGALRAMQAATALAAGAADKPVDGGNLGGDFWPHPWAEELAANPKGNDITFEDVVEHFNARREDQGLEALEEMSSPLVILEGIVDNSELSGQSGMNKAQRIADGIQGSSFLLSELTS
mmetsp:Transcript_16200/g.34297  ORF Transcript_16200/g.34297 Transcript_16200/m.34297 type:complete len:164 (-) Transcript_16200:69-560(-)